MRISIACFRYQKSLEGFDGKFQPPSDPKGDPRTGDRTVHPRRRECGPARAAGGGENTLSKALYENRLGERLKLLTRPNS